MTGGSQDEAWLASGRINGLSAFACTRLAGAFRPVASLRGDVAVGIAAGCDDWIFRRRDPRGLGIAGLLAVTLLAAPHAAASDAWRLDRAANVFFLLTRDGRFPGAGAVLAAAALLCPLLDPASVFRAGLLASLLLAAFLACIIAQLREKTTPAAGLGFYPGAGAPATGA